ncbi:hypothetical protein [Microbispora siamensis]|uniref:Uncharacterized protein n=1 Tax=Microbispora siamensis TaxID=564413 RepID=A0ABQ4GRK8_9ACTN|nr:hypothetical protein [Microbispora siamensis]GIH63985.1 hypothetical protein Msi02_48020 [Microbispora siamensis]
MTSNMPSAFPALPFSAVTFPDDGYLVVPLELIDGTLSDGAVVFWLLLVRLAEGHDEVEVALEQLQRHTGRTVAEINGYVRELHGWLGETRKGRMPGTYVFQIRRRPSVQRLKEWAADLEEPAPQPMPDAHRPSGPPAGPKHHAQFWRGLVDDAPPQL